jgi:hypothetical protein
MSAKVSRRFSASMVVIPTPMIAVLSMIPPYLTGLK